MKRARGLSATEEPLRPCCALGRHLRRAPNCRLNVGKLRLSKTVIIIKGLNKRSRLPRRQTLAEGSFPLAGVSLP